MNESDKELQYHKQTAGGRKLPCLKNQEENNKREKENWSIKHWRLWQVFIIFKP